MISPQPAPVLKLRQIQYDPDLWECRVCNTVYSFPKYVCPFCELLHQFTHKA